MELAQRRMEGSIRKLSDPFTIGQKVWLDGRNLTFRYPSVENEWLKTKDFCNAKETLADYKKQHVSILHFDLQPTAAQLLFLLNSTQYHERIINAARNNPLTDHLITDYHYHQQQHHHFKSLINAINYQINLIASDVAATGFVIPGHLTVPIICAPTIFFSSLPDNTDNTTTPRNSSSPTGGLEYPPQRPSEPLEDYELVEDPRPSSAPPVSTSRFSTDNFNRPEPSPSSEPRSSPDSPSRRHSTPIEPVPCSQRLQVQFSPDIEDIPITTREQLDRTPTPPPSPETGLLQTMNGTPLPGLSVCRPQNPPNANNADNETTNSKSPKSSLPINQVSMTDFLNAINAAEQSTIHRTVEITSAWYATRSVLTISLNIAHDFVGVNKFLSQGLPAVIHALTDLRMTMVIRPPSATSQMSHTSTEEEEPLPTRIVRITDDREPIMVTTPKGEERMFIPVRYVNGATVYEAGTSDQNRG
ncbi:hypothetical protein Moror_13447 [Moniliophthora roreri MCA 2997]|uniref:Uncharacterized protein n=2 Tax=Moniliophthora roreri TaxID=221103 RepID=V2WK98_MONRO|nr:hypothetical protein Moror_13447 [Moniliophthora roreri MCA 2997]